MSRRQANSHGLFFTVIFMCLIVVGTVVAYFVFLPGAAPKVIVLSVMPFTKDQEVPSYMALGYPSDLRNALSLSRDVLVVDFASSKDANYGAPHEFRGLLAQLGVTHFVDGHVAVGEDGGLIITPRLVNVSQPMWKEVWQQDFATSFEELQRTRNDIVRALRMKLYDLSVLRVPPLGGNSQGYQLYLSALHLLATERQDQALLTLRESVATSEASATHLTLAMFGPDREVTSNVRTAFELDNGNPDARALLIGIEIREHGLSATLLNELESLTSEYPNSVAVHALSQVYTALGWYDSAEQLLFKWARQHALSALAALEIAALRFRQNNLNGVEEALSISELRQPGNALSQRARQLLASNRSHGELLAQNGLSFYSSKCDSDVERSVALQDYDAAINALSCATRFWLTPPFFWSEDDPNWKEFRSHPLYQQHVKRLGFGEILLTGRTPKSVHGMFEPRRGDQSS